MRSKTRLTVLHVAVLACALLPGLARAAEIETERMTSPEIAAAVAAGRTTIIIPTGGTEQNGAHMVTGKHNFIVRETARRIAEKLGNALVAPVLAYVPEGDIASHEGHMGYPGTISVPPPVFEKVLAAAAESFAIHGFSLVVFLGDSGPNQAPQQRVAAELSRRWSGDGVRVISAGRYYEASEGAEWLKREGETEATIGSHAGIRDTSELLAVFPEGVRTEKAVADGAGISGDPTRASAERGRKLLDLKVEAAVNEIRAAQRGEGEAPPAPEEGLFRRLMRWAFG